MNRRPRRTPITLANDTTSAPGGCKLWRWSTRRGYGQIRIKGRLRQAPRVFWEKLNGRIPAHMDVYHTCENPLCCNVEHMKLLPRDRTMVEKKRARAMMGRVP